MSTLFDLQLKACDLKPGIKVKAPEHRGAVRTISRVQTLGSMTIIEYAETMGGRTYDHNDMVEVVS
ncbi:hypothetical protein [Corynebacterium sp. A21]|uniref:hypothetical protein n=1 Tax=Corynebacterium sp. A21 TaxID=3457318 RepID=UPI003FD51A22